MALTANITKLPVFKDQKVLLGRNLPQITHCPWTKVADDVGMRLQDTDGIAHVFSQLKEFLGRVDIGRHAEIGFLNSNQSQQVCRDWTCVWQSCAVIVRCGETRVPR